MTDNALEGTNNHVKGPDGTFRERLGILQFLKELEDGFIKRWATERNPIVTYPDGKEEANLNLKVFHLEPLHTLPDLTTACQWGKLGKTFKKYTDEYNIVYYCTPGCDENNKELKSLSSADCAAWFEKRDFADWPDYDSFIKHARKMRVVKLNKENYKLSECSCPTWCKYYKCKHMIDLCSRLGLLNYDSRVRSIPIGANRRRGAPSKTKGALVFQPNEECVQTVYSASDSESETQTVSKKKGPKSKKTKDSSDSEDSNFDLFEVVQAPKSKTAKAKEPSRTKQAKAKSSKETSAKETSKTKTKIVAKKKSAFAPRR